MVLEEILNGFSQSKEIYCKVSNETKHTAIFLKMSLRLGNTIVHL